MDTEDQFEQLVSLADDIGLFYEDHGWPRIWGKVLGWLLICQPDIQSAEDLARHYTPAEAVSARRPQR